MELDRRAFLKTMIGTLAAAGITGFSPRDIFSESRQPVREFHFSASKARVSLGAGPEFTAWTYNGQVPGPEIRVREGETVRVFLKNYLPQGTTIHWHGVPVPNAMDGVPEVTQKAVMPGQTFLYEFQARPAGSFIYHSHVGYQLDQGLYGPLIIEPSSSSPSHDSEYTLMLEDWVMRDDGGVAYTQRRPTMGMGMMRGMRGGMMGGMRGQRRGLGLGEVPLTEPVYDGYAINGKVYPAGDPIVVQKGARVKLRLLNSSSATIYDLRLAGHVLTVTHLDGNAVAPVETDVLRIGMGERYDVNFIADNPGTWLLAARESGYGEGMLRVPVQYEGVNRKEPVPPQFYPGLRWATYWDFQALHPDEPASPAVSRSYPQRLSGGMHSPYWTINGRVYPHTEHLGVRRGESVGLIYRNRSMMPHPMHLHGHFFNLVNPSLPRDSWIKKDTIIVYPMRQVAVEFLANNPGNWFHHCHNLYHMKAGMANVITYQS